MRSDAFFFAAIFFALFVGWVATGGPKKPISFSGPFITPVTSTGQTQQGYGSLPSGINLGSGGSVGGTSSSGSYGSTGTGNTQQDIWNAQNKLASLQKDYRDAQLFGTPSAYKDQVTLSGLNVSTTDPDQEYVTISTSWNAKEPIDITGWRLVSVATDNYGTIPGGVPLFRSGDVNYTQDIVLKPGEQAYVITGESPLGVSFKQNGCMGYLAARQKFYPGLYSYCPSPQSEFDRFYTGSDKQTIFCKNYITTLGSCVDRYDTPSSLPSSCIAFIDEYLSYNGCVAHHQYDQNFQGTNWRIYLGRHETNRHERKDLWEPQHDVLKLLDRDGKTVASYSY